MSEPAGATGHTDRVSGQSSDEKSTSWSVARVSSSFCSSVHSTEVRLAKRFDGTGAMGSTGDAWWTPGIVGSRATCRLDGVAAMGFAGVA